MCVSCAVRPSSCEVYPAPASLLCGLLVIVCMLCCVAGTVVVDWLCCVAGTVVIDFFYI